MYYNDWTCCTTRTKPNQSKPKETNMNNTLTPHKHAALIKQWAEHVASGAVDAGWYKVQSKQEYIGNWMLNSHAPDFSGSLDYRIVMTDKHPDYKPLEKKIKVEFETTPSRAEAILNLLRLNGLCSNSDFNALESSLYKARNGGAS